MDIINVVFSATILLALIWFAWWLRGKFDKIDNNTIINLTSFNPLTKSEVERLVIYVKVCQEGKRLLEYEEAKDFDQIAQKIKEERSDDVGAILIAGVAGLALGAYPTASE
ncbi:MAG: hypothetical protein FVQ77_05510 [Cytophagales bacterium]|nr:hypothetical protein [Cytophagales bacterium]